MSNFFKDTSLFFLYNEQTNIKNQKIIDNVDILFNKIINNNIKTPQHNDTFDTIVENDSTYGFNIQQSITAKGNVKYYNYNELKIKKIIKEKDPSFLLDYVDENFKSYFLTFIKVIDDFKLHIYDYNIYMMFHNNFKEQQTFFELNYDNFFKYIQNDLVFTETLPNLNYDYNLFYNFLFYNLFYTIYKKATDNIYSELLTNVLSVSSISINADIEFDFNIEDNKNEFNNNLSEYIENSILGLYNISTTFHNELLINSGEIYQNILNHCLQKIKDKFKIQHIQKLIKKTINRVANELSLSDFKSSYIDLNPIVVDTYEGSLSTYMDNKIQTQYKSIIETIEFIVYQNKNLGIDYINIYPYLYNKLNTMLIENNFCNNITVTDVKNYISYFGLIDVNNIKTDIDIIDFKTVINNSNSLQYEFNLYIFQILNDIFDEDETRDFLILNTSKIFNTTVIKYFPNDENVFIDYVDQIIDVIKIIFFQMITTNKFFNSLFNTISNIFQNTTVNMAITTEEINELKNDINIETFTNKFTTQIKNIYTSVYISKLKNKIIDRYKI